MNKAKAKATTAIENVLLSTFHNAGRDGRRTMMHAALSTTDEDAIKDREAIYDAMWAFGVSARDTPYAAEYEARKAFKEAKNSKISTSAKEFHLSKQTAEALAERDSGSLPLVDSHDASSEVKSAGESTTPNTTPTETSNSSDATRHETERLDPAPARHPGPPISFNSPRPSPALIRVSSPGDQTA